MKKGFHSGGQQETTLYKGGLCLKCIRACKIICLMFRNGYHYDIWVTKFVILSIINIAAPVVRHCEHWHIKPDVSLGHP